MGVKVAFPLSVIPMCFRGKNIENFRKYQTFSERRRKSLTTKKKNKSKTSKLKVSEGKKKLTKEEKIAKYG